MITQDAFDSVNSIFTNNNPLFLIPTFQRQFSWEPDREVDRLIADVLVAQQRHAKLHYLAAMHFIEIETRNPAHLALLREYVDTRLEIPHSNQNNGLIDDNQCPIQIYLVVDGQQRLTTLFAMMHTLGIGNLTISIQGQIIPRLIPSSLEEYNALRGAIGLPVLGNPVPIPNRAAIRIVNMFTALQNEPRLLQIKPYLQWSLKALLVCLDPNFALGSFLTLNDRGRKLTTLEKFKAHLLYIDQTAHTGLAQAIHVCFGHIYKSIEQNCSVVDDDILTQIFGLWELLNASKMVWWGAETWYEEAISQQVVIGGTWLRTLDSIADGNDYICNHLAGIYAPQPSQIQPNSRTTQDDYRIAESFGLHHRTLAVLFRFKSQFATDLHVKQASVTLFNQDRTYAKYIQLIG